MVLINLWCLLIHGAYLLPGYSVRALVVYVVKLDNLDAQNQ